MIKLYEEYIDYVALFQDLWNLYTPALSPDDMPGLTYRDVTLIRNILTKMGNGLSAADVAVDYPNEVETLKHCIKVHADHGYTEPIHQ